MLRFNDSTKVNTPLHRQISIHPMLRFNRVCRYCISYFDRYFNTSYVTVQLSFLVLYLNRKGDFNTSYVTVQPYNQFNNAAIDIRFQYILCYGSTCIEERMKQIEDEISIHPMLRFNGFNGS